MNSLVRFATFSLGCRTNQAEMEEVGLQLAKIGLIQNQKSPDLVLLNTCVVTGKAEMETRKEIRKLKRNYPQAKIIILGCAVNSQKLGIKLPNTDLLISNEQKDQIIPLLLNNFPNIRSSRYFYPEHSRRTRTISSKYQNSGRKFVKIQDGCDRFCSYCITCLIRSKPQSKPINRIISEIDKQLDLGVKEIILTGINLSLYQDKKIKFAELVNLILEKTKVERLSFSSIYPKLITNEFIELIINNPRINQYLHLSLQSGSTSVLHRMNRPTNIKKLTKSLQKIKQLNPKFILRADIITGFPDESESEFSETIQFVKDTKISFTHLFKYSSRPKTLADTMVKSKKWQLVEEKIKKLRLAKLKELINENYLNEINSLNNQTCKCLIINKNRGILENGMEIKLENRPKLIGQIVRTKINVINNHINGVLLFESFDKAQDKLWRELN